MRRKKILDKIAYLQDKRIEELSNELEKISSEIKNISEFESFD